MRGADDREKPKEYCSLKHDLISMYVNEFGSTYLYIIT